MSAHLVSTEVRVYPMVTMTSTATACPTGTMEIRVPLVSPFIFNDFSMVITAVTMYQQGNHCDNSMCTMQTRIPAHHHHANTAPRVLASRPSPTPASVHRLTLAPSVNF